MLRLYLAILPPMPCIWAAPWSPVFFPGQTGRLSELPDVL